MRVAVLTEPGAVEFRDEPDPIAGPEQVVVEIAASGICTFERRLFAGDTPWYPVAPGHEVAGTVIEVGASVDGLAGSPRLGDRVTVDLLTRCGTCGPCRRGRGLEARRRPAEEANTQNWWETHERETEGIDGARDVGGTALDGL